MLQWIDVINYANNGNELPDRRVEKSEAIWKAELSEEVFRITRQKGTESRFSGEHCSRYDPGIYQCTCCRTPLFDSSEKFDSKTGWPSFTQPMASNVIKYHKDRTFGMTRIEVLCSTCDAHLGHIFPDGPAPSGLRYCINSLSLIKQENNNNGE